jgi:hypothetical protein
MPYLFPRRTANPALSVGVVAGLATTRRRSQATSKRRSGCASVASTSGDSLAMLGAQLIGNRCPEPLTTRIFGRPLYCSQYFNAEAVELRALEEALEKREQALFYLSV